MAGVQSWCLGMNSMYISVEAQTLPFLRLRYVCVGRGRGDLHKEILAEISSLLHVTLLTGEV